MFFSVTSNDVKHSEVADHTSPCKCDFSSMSRISCLAREILKWIGHTPVISEKIPSIDASTSKIHPFSTYHPLPISPSPPKELLLLRELLEHKKMANNKRGKFEHFAQMIAITGSTNHFLLSKYLYLVNKHPEAVYEILDHHPTEESKTLLEEKFQQEIELIQQNLSRHLLNHKKSQLQPPETSYAARLPVEISKILLIETGKINRNLIPELISRFISNPGKPLNYETNLSFTLTSFLQSDELCNQLEDIQAPKSVNAPSNFIIRTMLGLSYTSSVDTLHTRQAVLAALLSHPRQGIEGGCFSTCVCIQLMSSNLSQCLKDFKNLIETNKLTRCHKGITRDFPFLLRLSDQNLNKRITLEKNGELYPNIKEPIFIWEAPGIQAACEAIGIKNPNEAVLKILETEESPLQTSVSNFLQKLAEYSHHYCPEPDRGIGYLFSIACFAFESEDNNPLQSIWRNAIAGMAEASEEGMVKSAIISSVTKILRKHLRRQENQSQKSIRLFLNKLQSELLETIYLHYDPWTFDRSLVEEYHSKEGGFVLYDKNKKMKSRQWIRVDSAEAFSEFMIRTVHRTAENNETFVYLAEQLTSFLATDTFILSLLYNYYPPNKETENLIDNLQKVRFSPWITRCGNDLTLVLQVYLENADFNSIEQFSPESPQELLQKIIQFSRSLSDDEKLMLRNNPLQHTPVRISDAHAFSLTLGHPSVQLACNNDTPISLWITHHVTTPGTEISNSIIDLNTRNEIISNLKETLGILDKRGLFEEQLNAISEEVSYSSFRNQIIALLREHQCDSIQKMSKEIDKIIIQNLPIEQKSRFLHSLFIFADTNWYVGTHDLLFCIGVNPGSGQLELMAIQDDEEKMIPLNQNYWVISQEWEIFPVSSCE